MAGSAQDYSLKAVLSCTDNLSPVFKKVRTNLRGLDRSFKNVVDSVSAVAGKLMLPLGALAGTGVFSLNTAIQKFADLGASVSQAAARAGIATGALQKLRLAAELGGASAEDMDDAVSELALKMSEALAGQNEDALQIFRALGIELQDTSGRTRNAAVVMRELSEAIRINTDSAERLRIVDILLGGDVGKRLIPVLEQGARGLDDMAAEAERLGIVMSQDDVKASAELRKTMTVFGHVVDSVSASIGSKLAPVLMQLVGHVQVAIVANKEFIATRVQEFVKEFAAVIEKVDFGDLIDDVLDFTRSVIDAVSAIGGFKTIAYAIAGIFGANLAANLLSVAGALGSLAKAAYALTGPWGMVAAGVAALAVVVYENFDDIKTWVSEAADWISSAFDAAADKVMQVWTGVKDFFKGIVDWITEKVSPIANLFSGLFSTQPRSVVQPAVNRPLSPAGGLTALERDRMRGEMVIRVEAAGGARAQVDYMNAAGLNLEANVSGQYGMDG